MKRLMPVLLLLSLTVLGTTSVPARLDIDRYELTLDVLPSSKVDGPQLLRPRRMSPDSYLCRAVVSPPGEQTVVTSAELVLTPGEDRLVTRKGDLYSIALSATISEARDRARIAVSVRKRGEVVLRQRSTIWLAAPEK
jgi:hypothetical protein